MPTVAVLFLVAFAIILWPWQARTCSEDRGKETEGHSERAYKSFEFFVKVMLVIVAGLGYLHVGKFPAPVKVIRQAELSLGWAAIGVATSLSLFIIIHQGSKLRRWEGIEWAKMPFWLEIWMCIAMMTFGIATWAVAHLW